MLSWLRRAVVSLLIFLIELATCLVLFITGMAFWRARLSLREARPVRVVAPAHHSQLNFACQLDTPALQSLFSNPEVVRDLRQLNAGITLSLVDLSAGRAQVVRRLNSAGIPVTAWLALPVSQGYYINATNSAEVGERFSAFQKWTADMGDLLSLRQLKLPVKVVVFNNGSLGFVELEMKATGFLKHGTDLVNPDFAKIAQGAGLFAVHVDDPEEVRPALEQAMAHDGPALVDIAVNRQELAMPPSLKLDQIVDFNLYMIKAILNGRGDEIIDLARTNLFR